MSSPYKKVFRFFSLPRELRDEVFSWVWGSLEISKQSQGFSCIRGVRFATYRVNVLLVSHQFSREYQDTMHRDPDFQTIILNGCHPGDAIKQHPPMQPLLRKRLSQIRALRVGIPGRILNAYTAEEIDYGRRLRLQSDMTTLFRSMPKLATVKIDSVVGSSWMELYLTHAGTVSQLCTITFDHWLFQDLPSNILDGVKLEIRLVMVSKLFHANPHCMDVDTVRRLTESSKNEIFYVCKPSTDAYSYRGMDLEVVEPVGSFEGAWGEVTAGSSAA